MTLDNHDNDETSRPTEDSKGTSEKIDKKPDTSSVPAFEKMVLSKLFLGLGTFRGATNFKQLISTRTVSSCSSHKSNNFWVKHYAITYMVVLMTSACTTMIGHALYTILYNPDINLPFWDKVPRYNTYARAEYTSRLPPNFDNRGIPVILTADGSVDFIDGEKVKPPTKDN